MSEAFVGMMVTSSVKLVRPLGEGGMGAVWVADHLALRTQVVVKFIAHGLKTNKEAQERFSREAAAASQVKSPHVVQTFDHGITDEGIPYIVMELLDGRDLGQYLEQEGKVSPELTIEIIGQLARALDRAHEKGIIHRDIKPGNIYLCDVGRGGEVFVKLLDFGIAKGVDLLNAGSGTGGIDSGTKTGSMVGSPFYMSPEQILGSKGIDHRSDLWSLGVVAYEMLTGQKPFDAETMGGLAIKIHSEPLPSPSRVSSELPPALDAWFQVVCARDVNQRYTSAKELTEELARALGGQVPRSLDAPRISTGGSRAARADAPTLAAGAATDAGVVRSATQSRVRSRLLVLLGIVVVVTSVAYVAVRAMFKKETATALVPPEPTLSAASSIVAAPTSTEPPPPPTSTSVTTLTPAIDPSASPAAMASSSHVAGAGGHRPRGNGNGARVTPVIASTPAPSLPPSLPSPPASAPPPKTATSGHDIF